MLRAFWDTASDGRFSSRKLEQATYDMAAFRFIAATIITTMARLRRSARFIKGIEGLIVQVLLLAREKGVLMGRSARRHENRRERQPAQRTV